MPYRKIFILGPLLMLVMLLAWDFLRQTSVRGGYSEPAHGQTRDQKIRGRLVLGPDQTKLASKSSTKSQPSQVLSINASGDLGLLGPDSKFTLRLLSNSAESLQALIVQDLRTASDHNQIEAASDDGATAVITFTDSMTYVFVKNASGVFEYTGSDFDGSLERTSKLNITDDMRLPDDRAIRLKRNVNPVIFKEVPDG